MEKAKEWLVEKLIQLVSPMPVWAWYCLFGSLLLLLFSALGAALYRLLRGDELKTKWFTLRPARSTSKLQTELEESRRSASGALATLKSEFDATYHLSNQRRILLDATKGVVNDLTAFMTGGVSAQPQQFLAELYRFTLKAMLSILRDDAQSPSRVGLFLPDPAQPGALMLADSCSDSFTAVEVQNKRLSVKESAAGFVFLTGREYVNPHLSERTDHIFKPRPDGAFPYETLICVPVRVGTCIRAVLCVDSQNPAAFGQEEIRYIHYTAALLGLILTVVEAQGAGFAEVAAAPETGKQRPPGGAEAEKSKTRATRIALRRRK